ncbi:MAG: hypothetical protein IPK92_05140 [Nitrospira sp.]|nr:hypothetical protein [Nitrospira sp.]
MLTQMWSLDSVSYARRDISRSRQAMQESLRALFHGQPMVDGTRYDDEWGVLQHAESHQATEEPP